MADEALRFELRQLELTRSEEGEGSRGALFVNGYRYRLWRAWGRGPRVVWLMLNPSTADAVEDDATVRRCIGFARRWGYAGIEVANLFGFVSTDPSVLLRVADPVGPSNDAHLLTALAEADLYRSARPGSAALVVAAWGADGRILGRERAVRQLLWERGFDVHCLGRTKDGYPRHPLRLSYGTPLERLEVPRA